VLFLTYERMKTRPKDSILKVTEFLDPEGMHYVRELEANGGTILEEVLEHSPLQAMKAHPRRWSSARAEHHTLFVRRGSVGGWKEIMNAQQARLLDGKVKATCSLEELKLLGESYCSPHKLGSTGPEYLPCTTRVEFESPAFCCDAIAFAALVLRETPLHSSSHQRCFVASRMLE